MLVKAVAGFHSILQHVEEVVAEEVVAEGMVTEGVKAAAAAAVAAVVALLLDLLLSYDEQPLPCARPPLAINSTAGRAEREHCWRLCEGGGVDACTEKTRQLVLWWAQRCPAEVQRGLFAPDRTRVQVRSPLREEVATSAACHSRPARL